MRRSNEQGVALITTLLVMMLMGAMLVGFTAVVTSDQRYRYIDRDRSQAFYAASAGIEKLTADLGNLFLGSVAPTPAQLSAVTTAKPIIDRVTFTAPLAAGVLPTSSLTRCTAPNAVGSSGTAGYTLRFCATGTGQPTTTVNAPIRSGPYEGLVALQMPFQLDVSAKTATGGEVHLVRSMEAVAIPVFQFGIFSDVDLSFFAGPNFNFGGRVHTNGNLFLSQGSGATLTLSDKVTAVGEIVRQRMQNNVSIDVAPAHAGTVNMAMSPGVYRALQRTEGSLVDGVNSAFNEPTWHSTSLSSYNSWIRNGRTGAKPLNLALITVGGSNANLVQRPVVDEDVNNPLVLQERLFGKASLRILLSDTANDITQLPTVGAAPPPVALDGDWRATPPNNGAGTYNNGGGIDASHPPIALSPGPWSAIIGTGAASGNNRTLVMPGPNIQIPVPFRVPDSFIIRVGAATWTLTGCSNWKSDTQIRCGNGAPGGHAGTTAIGGSTLEAVVTRPDGTVVTVQTNVATVRTTSGGATSTNWVNNPAPLFLDVTSTLGFAPESFWVNNDLVTCGGYDNGVAVALPGRFTNCTLTNTIANNSVMTNSFLSNAGTGTIGGFIKIERGNPDGTWTDVTMPILNYGIGAPNQGGVACGDPTPDAIVRIQRLRDNNYRTAAGVASWPGNVCPYAPSASSVSSDYWPNTLFDAREALVRDASPGTSMVLGGVMHYVTIDVQNLSEYFAGTGVYAAAGGNTAKTDNGGYTVYFSDRRNNRTAAGEETGEYGFEDVVNPSVGSGWPNAVLDAGEDVNANNTLEVYGGLPSYNGFPSTVPPGAVAPLNATANPMTLLRAGEAKVNRAVLFRRALKLINGSNIRGTGITGLTVVAENPVYVQGDWNATGGNFNGVHAATAVMADAVTLLSNGWTDNISYSQPYAPGNRPRDAQTWYRLAIISGKGIGFPQPTGTGTDFGTDGGAHNFLRYLENGNQPVNYRGSMATFFYARQAVGTFKCCATVYGAPTRNYAFDTDFLTPALLPPNTPMFRDLNAVGFAQELRPGR